MSEELSGSIDKANTFCSRNWPCEQRFPLKDFRRITEILRMGKSEVVIVVPMTSIDRRDINQVETFYRSLRAGEE